MYSRNINEECGVFGIISKESGSLAAIAATALFSLQHRGQEGAGIAYFDDSQLSYLDEYQLVCPKGPGLVADVFTKDVLAGLKKSRSALGHVKYSPPKMNSPENVQPMTTVHSKLTFALCYNGNIINAAEIKNDMVVNGGRVFHTANDSEILNKLIIDEFLKAGDIEKAVFSLLDHIRGSFSIVLITHNKLLALRDKNGFRPLCMGIKGEDYIFASESCAIESIGGKFIRDVEPGELVSVDIHGNVKTLRADLKDVNRGLCVFELVYFARPDSVIDGVSVYNSRIEMGKLLAAQSETRADVVCGVPDSGLEAAYGFHTASGIPLGQAFVKNRYIGRSFILPEQSLRETAVTVKLTPLKASIEGKRVVLVDDSIVRGTTAKRIIQSLKDAGAKEVHLRISSPPFKHICHFGADLGKAEDLIAANMSIEQIREFIGADTLEFLSVESLGKLHHGKGLEFCTGCFTGNYPLDVKKGGTKMP